MQKKIILNDSPYLSSKEASHLSGYTADYISRLCRTGKLRGQLVGKTWYVEQSSLEDFSVNYRRELDQKRSRLAEERRFEYQQQFVLLERQNRWRSFVSRYIVGHAFLQRAVAFSLSAFLVFGVYWSSQPPHAKEYSVVSVTVAQNVAVAVYKNVSATGDFVANVSSLSFDALRGDKLAQKEIRSVTNTFVDSAESWFENSILGMREQFAATSAYNDSYNIFEKTALFIHRNLSGLFDGARVIVQRSGNYLTDLTHVSFVENDSIDDSSRRSDRQVGGDSDGMVVVPSSGDSAVDQGEKEKIQKVFSDEVAVLSDVDGASGILKPVFREKKDSDYLYVLVPIKEEVLE